MRSEAVPLDFACGLVDADVQVLRIKGETELDGLEIVAYCERRQPTRRGVRGGS